MTKRIFKRLAVQAPALAATLALAACGAQPYPTPADEPPPPPPPPAALLGGGEAPPPPPVESPLPPPPPAEPAPYASQSYSGQAYSSAPLPPIIAMAPIPNPPEGETRRQRERREYREYGAYAPAPAPRARRSYRPYAPAEPTYRYTAPRHHAQPPAAAPAAPARPYVAPQPHAAPVTPHLAPAAPRPVPAAPARIAPPVHIAPPPTPKLAAPTPAPARPKVAAAPTLKTPAPEAATTANTVGAAENSVLGDRPTRLATLETALAEAMRKAAVLKAPAELAANTPAEVTLTVPAAFADTVKGEAGKNDLADAAASMNLTAVLSGDGIGVAPDTTQSQPLTPGQDTVFKWTVTSPTAVKPSLRADVGADLLGAGSDMLNLGSVSSGDAMGLFKAPRTYGIILLVAVAVLLLAWLARGQGAPARLAAARRAARRERVQPVTLADNEPKH